MDFAVRAAAAIDPRQQIARTVRGPERRIRSAQSKPFISSPKRRETSTPPPRDPFARAFADAWYHYVIAGF